MSKIFFLKNTETYNDSNNPEDTFLVYQQGYKFNENLKNVRYMDFKTFKQQYFSLHINKLILVGLNKIITPQNRCDMVFDFLQSMTRNIEKISIDTSPFIKEPWRFWYHLDITNQDKFNVPHGYAMETEWKHWFLRTNDSCRLSGENIKSFLPEIKTDLDLLNCKITLNPVDKSEIDYYNEIKEFSLQKGSDKLIINTLLNLCNKKYDIKYGFDSYRDNTTITLPDLGIYRFLKIENERRMNIYNQILKSGNGGKE